MDAKKKEREALLKAKEFAGEITTFGGKYSYLNGTEVVRDAYDLLGTIESAIAQPAQGEAVAVCPDCDIAGCKHLRAQPPADTIAVPPSIGDYVLATKYSDGDPGDSWALGFYAGEENGRHFVNDSDGNTIRAGGYRRVGRVREDVGHWMLNVAAKQLEQSPPGTVNLWAMLTDAAKSTGEDV